MTDLGALSVELVRNALAAIAPPGVRTGVLEISARHEHDLHAGEAEAIVHALPPRRHEFSSGRALLRHLIGSDVDIPVGSTRAPLLPAGVIGSISHDDGLVAGAVAFGAAQALGIDIERVGSLTPNEATVVLRADEPDINAGLAFVLKEATYKAWSVLGGGMVDFHAVRVTVDGNRFNSTFIGRGANLEGRFVETDGRWIALVVHPWPPTTPS